MQIYFGKAVVEKLGPCVQQYGKNVLLLYGGGSVKRNGSYDDVVAQLQKIAKILNVDIKDFFEYTEHSEKNWPLK